MSIAIQRFSLSKIQKTMSYVCAITTGIALMSGGIAQANLLSNGSFETPASTNVPSLPVGSTYLTGWTVYNQEIAHIPNGAFSLFASDGLYSLDLAGYHDFLPYGGVQQTIATTAGAVYDISFDVGAVNGVTSVEVTAGSLLGAATSSAQQSNVGVWTTYNSTFTALGSLTTISLKGTGASSGGTYVGLDNVNVTFNHFAVAVPEPETYAMMLAGLGLLGFSAKRRKQQSAG